MSRFPTASFESQSQAITNRMLGVKASIDDMTQRMSGISPSSPNSSNQVLELGSLTEQFCEVQEQVQKRLADASTVMVAVQQALASTLTSCEQFATGLAFNVKRMVGNGGTQALDPAVVSSSRELLLLHTHAMNLFSEVLTMQDADDQEAILRENDELFDERDRLMSQFTIQSQAASRPRQPTRSEKNPDAPPVYSPSASETPAITASETPSIASSSTAPLSPASDEGGITGWFKTLKSLPSLLRRVEPLVSTLCQAAAVGSIAQMDGLLSEGANIEGLNEDGNTPLISAVLSGQVDAVGYLLDKGAKLTTKDSNLVIPPLFHAALAGKLDVMTLLLDLGADPNARGTYGNPFFVGAVSKAPLPAVRLLLDRGAEANTTGINGKHVIVVAAQRGDLDLVKLLLNRGVSVSTRAPSGQSLISIVVDVGSVPLAKLLLDRDADVNSRMPSGGTVLSLAVSKNNFEMAELLLSRGADVDSRDMSGQSLVGGCVAKDRDPKLLKLLLDHGADVSIRDLSNKTPLANAISAGNFDLARTLLSYGSDPNDTPSWQGVTSSPLGHCIQKDRLDGVKLLLEFQADPNKADHQGQTPLLFSVSKNKTEAVKLLLSASGNPNVRNGSGDTALALAVKEGNMELVRLLLRASGNPNVRNGSGETALAFAVKDGNMEMVRLLLQHGALVFRGSKSAVEIAKKSGRADILRVLEASRTPSSSSVTSATAAEHANQDAPPAYGE